jgi:hypothetical protein
MTMCFEQGEPLAMIPLSIVDVVTRFCLVVVVEEEVVRGSVDVLVDAVVVLADVVFLYVVVLADVVVL